MPNILESYAKHSYRYLRHYYSLVLSLVLCTISNPNPGLYKLYSVEL